MGSRTFFQIVHHIKQRPAEKRAAHHRNHQKSAAGQINHAKHQRRKNFPDLRKRNAPYARGRVHPGNTRGPVLRAVRPDLLPAQPRADRQSSITKSKKPPTPTAASAPSSSGSQTRQVKSAAWAYPGILSGRQVKRRPLKHQKRQIRNRQS
jgi:hypothetical protein